MNWEVDGWTDVAFKVNNNKQAVRQIKNKRTNKQMNRKVAVWTDVVRKVNNMKKQTNRQTAVQVGS